ncbi:MAG TPA: thioredoxin family protein [Saprospiraceae bacterium]|jgi:hypothetical protein|nr:thioredoxin family protein [Saprospiraceae bacterium]WKZ61823.1 MAG: thioredoxin family protein [Saprospiraceae bacterium]HQN55925.1 thioredoxin family protein [Saprospiraceae bacterium]HRN34140.1 thioredoxin family protein [Saprospiraceae bacterium]HRP84679.1 thioredoxin family protein [Saprospiraceae bacterium]
MDIKKFWDEGLTYDEYIALSQKRLDHPANEEEAEKREYYELALQRMSRMTKRYVPDAGQVEAFAGKNFDGKVLIITEPWCGDASQAVPVANKFFEKNGVRITLRDQEPSLIDDFLTDGAKSIPIILFIDDNWKVVAQWGPRPAFGYELFLKYKANPEEYTKEQFHNDLQVYYAKNKGYDTIEEILDKL